MNPESKAQDAQAQSQNPVRTVSFSTGTQQPVSELVRQRVDDIARTHLRSDNNEEVFDGYRQLQRLLGLKEESSRSFERMKIIARIFRAMMEQGIDPVDTTVLLSRPEALATIFNNQGGIFQLANLGNGPSFSPIGTHGYYAKNAQGLIKAATDEALMRKGFKTLASVSKYDHLVVESKKLGASSNVDLLCAKYGFAPAPGDRVVITPAPNGQARSRSEQHQPYMDGTLRIEINDNNVPKTYATTVDFYPRYHVIQMNYEVSNIVRNIMVTQDPKNPVITEEGYQKWLDYAAGYTLTNGTPEGQMSRYQKVQTVAAKQKEVKVLDTVTEWIVETEKPRYKPPTFIQDYNKYKSLVDFQNALLHYYHDLAEQMLGDLDPYDDWDEERRARFRSTVTGPFWTPNPAADSGIATPTTKKNRELPGDSIFCVADQLLGVLITAAEKDIANGTTTNLTNMLHTTNIFWLGKFKNKREIVKVSDHTEKTRNYVNFSVFSQLFPMLFNSFVVRTMIPMEHDQPWPISHVGEFPDPDAGPNMMKGRYLAKFNPTAGRLSKFVQSMVDNRVDGAYYTYYYSDNFYVGQYHEDTKQWSSYSLDGVKMEASHQQMHWDAYLEVYLQNAGVDRDSAVGRVFTEIFYKMTRDCLAVWGKCVVPFKALPSGFAGTTEINSMLMRQVGIGVETLLSVPRTVVDHDDSEMLSRAFVIPRVESLINYITEYVNERGYKDTPADIARKVFSCRGPVDMIHMYADLEECGMIGIIARGLGVELTNEANVEPIKDLLDPQVRSARLDMLGFNATLTKVEGTDKLVIVSTLREESLIKATLFDKTMVKPTSIEEVDTAGFEREIIDLGKIVSLYLIGGWNNHEMGVGAVLQALYSKTASKIRMTEEKYAQVDAVCSLMLDPDPFESGPVKFVSNVKLTLQAMYKLQVEPSIVESLDIESGTVFTEVYPDEIDIDGVPDPQPTGQNQKPITENPYIKLSGQELRHYKEKIDQHKSDKVIGCQIDVSTCLVDQNVTIQKAKRNMAELLDMFENLILHNEYDGAEKKLTEKFVNFCMLATQLRKAVPDQVLSPKVQADSARYFFCVLLQIAQSNHLGHLSYVVAKASLASYMPITPYGLTLEQFVQCIRQACQNSLFRNVLYTGPILNKTVVGKYDNDPQSIYEDWRSYRKKVQELGDAYEKGQKMAVPRVILDHQEMYKVLAQKKSMPAPAKKTDLFGVKVPSRVNSFIPQDEFISDTSKFVMYTTPAYAVEHGELIRYPLAISRPVYQKLRTVQFARNVGIPVKYLGDPKIKDAIKQALARNSVTILINLTGDTTVLNNPIADFMRGWPAQQFRHDMVRLFATYKSDKAKRDPWKDIQRNFRIQYPMIEFPKVRDPDQLVQDVNGFNLNEKSVGAKYQRIMGAMMFGIPASAVPDSFTEFYAAARDTCAQLVPSATPPLLSWLQQHLGIPQHQGTEVGAPIGNLMMEAQAGCLTPASYSIRFDDRGGTEAGRFLEFPSVNAEFINIVTKIRLQARAERMVKGIMVDGRDVMMTDLTHYLKRKDDPQVKVILEQLVKERLISHQKAGLKFHTKGMEKVTSLGNKTGKSYQQVIKGMQSDMDEGRGVLEETLYSLISRDVRIGRNHYDSPSYIVQRRTAPPDEVFKARGYTAETWNTELKKLSGQASADPIRFSLQLRQFLTQFIYLNQTFTITKMCANAVAPGCFVEAARAQTTDVVERFHYPETFWSITEYFAWAFWEQPLPDQNGKAEARQFQFTFMARLMPRGPLFRWYTVQSQALTGYPAMAEEPENRSRENYYMNIMMDHVFVNPSQRQTDQLVALLKGQKANLFQLDYGEIVREFNAAAVNEDGKGHRVPESRVTLGRREKGQARPEPP